MPLGRFGLSPAHGIWKPIQRSRRKHATIRLPEQLETRNLLAGDTSTSLHVVALDVNADGALTPLDALLVVNQLNRESQGAAGEAPADSIRQLLDVNADGSLSALDALAVINRLNVRGSGRILLEELIGISDRGLSELQRTNLRDFFSELNAFRRRAGITPEKVTAVLNAVTDILDDFTLPTQQQLDQLVREFMSAAADNSFSLLESMRLLSSVRSFLQNSNITAREIDNLLTAVGDLVRAPGLTAEDLQQIGNQVLALIQEFRDGLELNEDQRDAVRQLLTDVSTLVSAVQVSPEQLQALQTSFANLAQGATPPALDPIVSFIDDWREARLDGTVSDAEGQTLANGLVAILNSANLPPSAWAALVDDVAAVVNEARLSDSDLEPILEDVAAIRDAFQATGMRLLTQIADLWRRFRIFF